MHTHISTASKWPEMDLVHFDSGLTVGICAHRRTQQAAAPLQFSWATAHDAYSSSLRASGALSRAPRRSKRPSASHCSGCCRETCMSSSQVHAQVIELLDFCSARLRVCYQPHTYGKPYDAYGWSEHRLATD